MQPGKVFKRLWCCCGEDTVYGLDGFPHGYVGEPRWSNDVAGCVDSRHVGLIAIVYLDKPFGSSLRDNPEGTKGDTPMATSAQSASKVCFCLDSTVRRTPSFVVTVSVTLGAGKDLDALFGKRFFKGHTDLGVFYGQNIWQHFDESYFCAECVEEIRKFNPDCSCANNEKPFRLRIDNHGVMAIDNGLTVDRQTGHWSRGSTGSNQDGIRLQDLFFTVGAFMQYVQAQGSKRWP